jgi:hypothetical protein
VKPMTKKINTRGMNIDQALALIGKEIDEVFEEKEEQFRIDTEDAGFSTDDVNELIESRRAEKLQWRKNALAEMRRLLSGGERLNS